MLIAQMTDIHIGFELDAGDEELNFRRFRATLQRLLDQPDRPDMLLLTGDLTEHGDAASYARLADTLAACPIPTHVIPGNHDNRDRLIEALPSHVSQDCFVHFVIEREGFRIVCLDTLEPGRHGGAFCEARAKWFASQLAAAPDIPTMVFMHHPPVVSGIDWMDPRPDEAWIARFRDCVSGNDQIVAIHCGHLHRPLVTSFAGIPLSVTPSVAPLVALDLQKIDPESPDGRALITTEPPTYALHYWDGAALVSHYETIGDWQVLESYRPQMQPMIRAALSERGTG